MNCNVLIVSTTGRKTVEQMSMCRVVSHSIYIYIYGGKDSIYGLDCAHSTLHTEHMKNTLGSFLPAFVIRVVLLPICLFLRL